jgi:hypothetical protein
VTGPFVLLASDRRTVLSDALRRLVLEPITYRRAGEVSTSAELGSPDPAAP